MTTSGAITTIGTMRRHLADEVRRVVFQHSFGHRACAHATANGEVTFDEAICQACAQRGDTWVKLRMCMTCGSVGCCDSTPAMHARAHYEATGHPVIRSIEPGESWAWCYLDRAYIGSVPIPI